MKDDVSIRRADISELSVLLCWRMEVLHAVFGLPETDFFSGAVCVSGSLWYPGFCEFALSHAFRRVPDGVYLSLGDRENISKNPALQKTEAVFRTLNEQYARGGLAAIFELNPGNHYRDTDLRMAKGIRWLLTR